MSYRAKLVKAREKFLQGIGVPVAGEFQIDPFQEEAIKWISEGFDVLVVAPTGAGKTFIAFQAIKSALERSESAVYTTPLKALSNTKYTELKRRFEPMYSVGLLTGDRKIEGDSSVVVATTEIYRNELYRGEQRYSLVVLDEVHYISDTQRGPVWEESIILTPPTTKLLMLSASISNSQEIASWIESVRGKPCKIVKRSERPVELRYGFLHPEHGVLPLRDEQGNVLPEVSDYYQNATLDASGMRLRQVLPRRSGNRLGRVRANSNNTMKRRR